MEATNYQYITEEVEEYIIKMRRHFHKNPELGWREHLK